MMLRIWHIPFFVAALAVFAVMSAPATLIAQREGVFTYERATGTIWKGRFEDAHVGKLDAGDIEWRMSFGDLVQGKMNAHADLSGADVQGSLNILANWRGDRRLIAPVVRIHGAPIGRNLSLAGLTTIRNLDVYYSRGRCVTAQGTLESDIPSSNAAVLHWRGPNLAGTASCVGDAAHLTLEGAGEGDRLRTTLELHANGAGVWRAEVRSTKPELTAVLRTAGFGSDQALDSASIQGTFQWFPF
jgi:hypothetical protein